MEENQNQKKESVPEEEPKELNKENIYDQYQKEDKKAPEEKEEDKKEDSKEKENTPQKKQTSEINLSENKKNENNKNNNEENNNNSVERSKRRRRGKNEISDRNYRCPECDKCYLSGPALTTHRKTKHGYGNNGEKKNRGRPKKEGQNENAQTSPLNKFNNFFNDEQRKANSLDQTLNDKMITTEIIQEYFKKIFSQCKKELFNNIENIENYSFYTLFIENWDKENPFPNQECFSGNTKVGEASCKVQSYNLDELFFFYLKEFSKKTNKEYFWFMMKFIVLFRECINTLRKDLIKQEDKSELKKEYTQIYNAETVPEICNDFFVEFMEPYSFFGLLKEELIELIQHFCYWLYSKQYAQSHLTLLDS